MHFLGFWGLGRGRGGQGDPRHLLRSSAPAIIRLRVQLSPSPHSTPCLPKDSVFSEPRQPVSFCTFSARRLKQLQGLLMGYSDSRFCNQILSVPTLNFALLTVFTAVSPWGSKSFSSDEIVMDSPLCSPHPRPPGWVSNRKIHTWCHCIYLTIKLRRYKAIESK